MVSTQKPEASNRPSGASSQQSDNKRPASAAAAATSSTPTSETEKLSRAWRSLVSAVVVATRAADKHSKQARGGGDATRHNKELEEAVDQTLRARNDFRRYVTATEATLLGQAKETEALVGMLQSQPRMGRKRKNRESVPENADPL
mmetsp:Transcript_16605/g.27519  ORF Transcript_16605/g.27519 Transcript_16605/m.27519 type:complete len:146 (+) Transcript_16605:60-497(+)|eukprot:CAMPEP_0119006842 /NCGR_PEP_ID=MMETSP1176-20130426/2577_1 /TAXON_ID=265551 /ORGANISM="Synedropsis recta cf, Strain CCMP1620" /LENGTH=145 /DNA_ID=CAMNT_0006958847 /DNA_START=57 /DNA_END=494 /DNA_ORIENTATION=-